MKQKELHWKVCGMREPKNIQAVLELGPDFMGFIFYPPSSRYVEINEHTPFIRNIDGVCKTGVFVNQDINFIMERVRLFDLQAVQLHGTESPAFCTQLKAEASDLKVIKVFSIGNDFDFSKLEPYEECCDLFLFDTKGKLPGGNGYTFNWEILESYEGNKPFFLSGGISISNAEKVLSMNQLPIYGIDVNSKFEDAPALKNPDQLKALKQSLNF